MNAKIATVRYLDKLIIVSARKLNQFHLYLLKKKLTTLKNDDNYEMLFPSFEADKNGYYSTPLDIALRTDRANNIAITGSYGSGKSSFLRTFEAKNVQWNYLPISLATFKEPKEIKTDDKATKKDTEESTDDSSTESKEEKPQKDKFELNQDIERSILQQFFYREKDKNIPYSRFKRIRNTRGRNIVTHSILIGFLLLYGWRSFFEKSFNLFLPFNILDELNIQVVSLLATALLFFYFYKLVRFFWNLQISKFNFKKGEITLARQEKASILNEHLDEILYFFEVTSYDAVIFEDLDRFDTTEIFIKLRELNNLINNAKQIGRRVIFIYAIKDDMFIDKERSKFFDFIIPIIPYINPSNSEAKLKEKFKTQIETRQLDSHFLDDISLYIDDMRLLLNIYNEYMIYQYNLQSDSLNYNKLLALIVCKNFYPSEFAKLHYRDGVIYRLFANKPFYIREALNGLDKEKNKLREQIKTIEKENIQSLEELRLLYIGKFVKKTGNTHFKINNTGGEHKISELSSDEIFDKFGTSDDTIYSHQKSSNYHYNSEQKNIPFKDFNDKETFQERKSHIEDRHNGEINRLKKEIEEIDEKINQLKNADLKELFEKSSDSIDLKECEDKTLLVFLVRNGHIQEDYEHYISYFHAGSITQNDREFLLSVKNQKPLEPTFPLGNIHELIKKLAPEEFKERAILNCDLLKYILNNISDTDDKKIAFLAHLSDGSDKVSTFIFNSFGLLSKDEQIKLIQNLKWDGFWKYIADNFSDDKQNEFFEVIFDALTLEIIIALNIDDSLKLFIENKTILPKYEPEKTTKYQKLLTKLNIRYRQIKNSSDNKSFFEYIYANNLYQLNQEMIAVIIDDKIDSLDTAHLTAIYKSQAKNLIEYLEENINFYVENVLLKIDTNTQESEEIILKLLNDDDILPNNKIAIIEKEETKIQDITKVKNKELWGELYRTNKIVANWDNIIHYYIEQKTLTKELISFLNQQENYEKLSSSKINNEQLFDKTEILQPLNRAIISASELTDDAYNYLIKSVWFWYSSLDIQKLNSSKINSILDSNKLGLTQENIDALKEHFSPRHIKLIESFKDKFIEGFGEFDLDANDVLLLLNSDKFTIEQKTVFLNQVQASMFDDSTPLKEVASRLYIDSKLRIDDINLFEKMFYGENKYDLELLISQLEYFENCDICKKYLAALREPYSELLEKNAKPLLLENTKQNKQLLQLLKDKDCISSFSDEKKEIKVNRKRS